jgi:hypothetical protein
LNVKLAAVKAASLSITRVASCRLIFWAARATIPATTVDWRAIRTSPSLTGGTAGREKREEKRRRIIKIRLAKKHLLLDNTKPPL